MSKPQLSDEQRILRAKRRFREALLAVPLACVAGAVLGFLFVKADEAGLFQRLGFGQAETQNALILLLAAISVAIMIFAVIRYWTPRVERQPAFLRKDMDNIHRRWRWVTLILSAVSVLNTANFVLRPQEQTAFSGGAAVFMLFALALTVCFGPGFLSKTYRETLNDELMRTHRAKAARLGYLLALPGLAVLYFVQRDQPQIAGPAAMTLLCAICALPALYFVILDWLSERGDNQ